MLAIRSGPSRSSGPRRIAKGGSRTPIAFRLPDPKSGASASSATFASDRIGKGIGLCAGNPHEAAATGAGEDEPQVRDEGYEPSLTPVIAGRADGAGEFHRRDFQRPSGLRIGQRRRLLRMPSKGGRGGVNEEPVEGILRSQLSHSPDIVARSSTVHYTECRGLSPLPGTGPASGDRPRSCLGLASGV